MWALTRSMNAPNASIPDRNTDLILGTKYSRRIPEDPINSNTRDSSGIIHGLVVESLLFQQTMYLLLRMLLTWLMRFTDSWWCCVAMCCAVLWSYVWWCDEMCYVLWCGVLCCIVVLCRVAMCSVVMWCWCWCVVIWSDVIPMWIDVNWCDVMWCDVMWCDALSRTIAHHYSIISIFK